MGRLPWELHVLQAEYLLLPVSALLPPDQLHKTAWSETSVNHCLNNTNTQMNEMCVFVSFSQDRQSIIAYVDRQNLLHNFFYVFSASFKMA